MAGILSHGFWRVVSDGRGGRHVQASAAWPSPLRPRASPSVQRRLCRDHQQSCGLGPEILPANADNAPAWLKYAGVVAEARMGRR